MILSSDGSSNTGEAVSAKHALSRIAAEIPVGDAGWISHVLDRLLRLLADLEALPQLDSALAARRADLSSAEKLLRDFFSAKGLAPGTSMPTIDELTRWLASGHCPKQTLDEVGLRLGRLWGRGPVEVIGYRNGAIMVTHNGTEWAASIAGTTEEALARNLPPPLMPIIHGWCAPPKPVSAATEHESGRIIPGQLAMVDTSDSRCGKHFAYPAHVTSLAGAYQMVLPGFALPNTLPLLPTHMYYLGEEPGSKNRAAPTPLRILIEATMAVPLDDRNVGQPVAFSPTLREILRWLYVGRRPKPNEYMGILQRARDVLDSDEALVPWYDPETQTGRLRRLVSINDVPLRPRSLEERIRIIVDLPPGSGPGPKITPNLRYWGSKSAAAYRLLINLSFFWHKPGRTIVPVGKPPHQRWVFSTNPDRFDSLSPGDLVKMTFPRSRRGRSSNLVSDARAIVDKLQQAGELTIIDGKYLPPVKP